MGEGVGEREPGCPAVPPQVEVELAVRELRCRTVRDDEGQRGLADAAHAGERDDARACAGTTRRSGQAGLDVGRERLASDQHRGSSRQLVRSSGPSDAATLGRARGFAARGDGRGLQRGGVVLVEAQRRDQQGDRVATGTKPMAAFERPDAVDAQP